MFPFNWLDKPPNMGNLWGICLFCRRPEPPNPRELCWKLPGCSWTKDLDENFQGGSRAQFFFEQWLA